MDVKNPVKPTKQALRRYEKLLESFLSAHDVSVVVELWDPPLRMETFMSGEKTNIENSWVKDIAIAIADEMKFKMRPRGRNFISEEMAEKDIWLDAWEIQNSFYEKAGKERGSPQGGGRFWQLWEHHPEKRTGSKAA